MGVNWPYWAATAVFVAGFAVLVAGGEVMGRGIERDCYATARRGIRLARIGFLISILGGVAGLLVSILGGVGWMAVR
jgi:hypothetical protein